MTAKQSSEADISNVSQLLGAALVRRILTALIAAAAPVAAQQKSVDYDVSFPNAAEHEAIVTATFRGIPAGQTLQLRMSRSSPGRYSASGFGKNVYDISAVDGQNRATPVTRGGAYEWSVARHNGSVKVTYKVWGDRTDGSYLSVDHSHAHMNMPATFMFARGMDAAPIKLTIHPQPGWRVATQLVPTSDPNVFTAPNMPWFMDSPTEVGPVNFRSWTSTYNGRASAWRISLHHLGTDAQLDSLTSYVHQIVDEEVAIWGEPAGYDLGTYTFILDYLPWASGDGMEHRNSTIITGSTPIPDRAAQLRKLQTIAHEFFHSWNMERLRSKGIEPFDFERENMSGELWLGEGFTNYYGPLVVRRSGFITDEDFIRSFGGEIVGTILSPARRHGTPVTMSENAVFFDGGTYQDPANRQNTFLSYYTWGSVVACGLDLILREKYHLTLDDYMRALWRDYGSRQNAAWAPARPYTIRDLETELATLTKDAPFARDFLRRYVEGSDVPDFATLLKPAGVLLQSDSAETPYLGASLDDDTTAVFVNWSQEGGSAFGAGISSGDRIYAVDGTATTSIDSLNAILKRHKPGDVVQVDVMAREVRRTIPMKIVGRRGMRIISYETAGLQVTDAMRAFRQSWLGSARGRH